MSAQQGFPPLPYSSLLLSSLFSSPLSSVPLLLFSSFPLLSPPSSPPLSSPFFKRRKGPTVECQNKPLVRIRASVDFVCGCVSLRSCVCLLLDKQKRKERQTMKDIPPLTLTLSEGIAGTSLSRAGCMQIPTGLSSTFIAGYEF